MPTFVASSAFLIEEHFLAYLALKNRRMSQILVTLEAFFAVEDFTTFITSWKIRLIEIL
jgi:hypothetical protein